MKMRNLYVLKYALLLLLAAPAAAQTAPTVVPGPIEVMFVSSDGTGTQLAVTQAVKARINENTRYRVATTSTDFETIEIGITCETGNQGVCAVLTSVAYTGEIRFILDLSVYTGDINDANSFMSNGIYNYFVNGTNDEEMAKVRKRCRDDLIGLKAALSDTKGKQTSTQKM